MISFHQLLVWIFLALICSQVVVSLTLSREKREADDMESEMAKPPGMTGPGGSVPYAEMLLNTVLRPFQYITQILQNVIQVFAQIGHNIVTSINDRFTAIATPTPK